MWHKQNLEYLEDILFDLPHTRTVYCICMVESVTVSNITEKRVNRFSWNSGQVGYDIENNLEHIEDIALNLLGPGSIYAFAGSVLASNIMGKRIHGFSWILQDMLEITQQNNYRDCASVFVSDIMEGEWIFVNFQDMLDMTYETFG